LPTIGRIYGTREDEIAILDYEDYLWAVQWCWHVNVPHITRKGRKLYFVRQQSNGRRYSPKLYLHVEIMKRTGIEPPGPEYTLTDHLDGNEWNCRKINLQWATTSMNRISAKPRNLLPKPAR
jgi:hypothetical protein